jgi:chromosome segregation ATPase
MFDEAILTRWIEERSDIALKKLMNHEPLTFEDNMIFALVGQCEEMKRFEKRVDEKFARVDERFGYFEQRIDEKFARVDEKFARVDADIADLKREMVELRKEMVGIRQDINTLTRWILTAIVAVPVLMKLLDVLLLKR